jgi:DNA mismatch repair protein MutS
MKTATPMMSQYRKIKEEHGDTILFFRLGDFYEMFEQDAIIASKILDLTLTKRNDVPMCGIPYHAAQNYISKLLKAKKKIAICEQTFIPKPGKGIATREVVEIITPGTVVDENLLERNVNNYLVAIGKTGNTISFACIDLSTADFYACSFDAETRAERIKRELARISTMEVIVQESLLEEDEIIERILSEKAGIVVNRYPDWYFDFDASKKRIEKQLGVHNLKGFGLTDNSAEILAAGVIIEYIGETSKSLLPHIKTLKVYSENAFVTLDEATQKNLELVTNLADSSQRYTLLEVLDETKTSMGSRKLRKTILSPLIDTKQISKRLDSVEYFYRNQAFLEKIREELSRILDIERLCSRIALDKAHAKDLLAINSSLEGILSIYEQTKSHEKLKDFTSVIEKNVDDIRQVKKLLSDSIHENPSILLTEGNLIRHGYSEELDRLHDLKSNSRKVLDAYLQEEREKSGISTLKLRYNRIIGYYFEITKSNLHLAPSHFIRRQSIIGGERFSTNELIEKETEINSSSEKIIELERGLFLKIRAQVKENISLFLVIADVIAELDVMQSFATASTIHGYTRPVVDEEDRIEIIDGRHPVVEANIPRGTFVPNSVCLSLKDGNFILLTGPNMAGKSTFLRQVALIVLMAQLGCFIPASEAKIGIVDKIFLRVGASDNLARGESTFLVEMNETANILRTATPKSLLILDEVGRGTSTKDGFSIARAVTEYILEKIGAKTIFATHFRELTSLEHEKLRNLSMEVLETKGEIVFLKRLKSGPADNSYGIHVAKLAGLPEEVVKRAEQILSRIEDIKTDPISTPFPESRIDQSMLFSASEMILNEMRNINIENTPPLKALTTIARWQEELENSE